MLDYMRARRGRGGFWHPAAKQFGGYTSIFLLQVLLFSFSVGGPQAPWPRSTRLRAQEGHRHPAAECA
eukprot:3252221-Lingulodinium_polyedra.AAC.1